MTRMGIALVLATTATARASDHLDTPAVVADPAADIGDVYGWTSSDGRQLELVMTIVGKRFSDQVQYAFHVDSGATTTTILCRFDVAATAECWAGDADYARGDASSPDGLVGKAGRFRVFAGVRDDPFFNNVKGTRAALTVAREAFAATPRDAAGCPRFAPEVVARVREEWRHTAGGPPTDLLAGWKTSALVVSIDLDVVRGGGPLLAIWGGTYKP